MLESVRKITSKNQISLTKEAMDSMGVKIGDHIRLELDPGKKRVILVPGDLEFKKRK